MWKVLNAVFKARVTLAGQMLCIHCIFWPALFAARFTMLAYVYHSVLWTRLVCCFRGQDNRVWILRVDSYDSLSCIFWIIEPVYPRLSMQVYHYHTHWTMKMLGCCQGQGSDPQVPYNFIWFAYVHLFWTIVNLMLIHYYHAKCYSECFTQRICFAM